MASFDRSILPGGEGKVKIQVQTSGHAGQLEKTASIYSNDPDKPVNAIKIQAQVKAIIIVSPDFLQLSGKKGETVSGDVEVKANIDKPLTLKPGLFNLTGRVIYTVSEIEKGKKFLVHFQSAHVLTEPLQGYLHLETNYPEKPEVTLFIRCDFVPPN